MAKFKINLIPGEERSRLDLSLWAKRLKTLAVSLLAVFTGLSGLVFLQYFRLRNDTETVNAKIIQAEKSILGLQLREQDLSKLKNRLQLAQKIMGLRRGNVEILKKFDELSSKTIIFETVESKGKGELSLMVTSPDLLGLNQFMTEISRPEFTQNFDKLEVSSVSRSEDGDYSFILDALKKTVIKETEK
ncbi:MAG: hypothetical protein BWY24_00365 [Microgenomates group bacterium ADurb.Bin219]|nr:MAG: hypothetical protein BWY24_00365 [Microgenomates group bacterium ADurb.Bin219]HNP89450.1 hypothetical protein [Candidatus Woesebacteria bacterium]